MGGGLCGWAAVWWSGRGDGRDVAVATASGAEDAMATEAFLCCGLPSEDPRLREEQAHLPEERYEQEQPPLRDESSRRGEKWRDGRLLVASDGSGDHPREERLRRCGEKNGRR